MRSGLDQARHAHGAPPPVHRRLTDAACTARQATRQDPHGCARSTPLRVWWAEAPPGSLSYAGVHALVRSTLHAPPQRPRPLHAQNVRPR
jgi:hypothetical protein